MRYVCNAFSLQMLKDTGVSINISINLKEISERTFKRLAENAKSIIGHKDLANLLGLEFNRESIKIDKNDELIVCQVWNGRLPEGCTTLPDDVELKYFYITFKDKSMNIMPRMELSAEPRIALPVQSKDEIAKNAKNILLDALSVDYDNSKIMRRDYNE